MSPPKSTMFFGRARPIYSLSIPFTRRMGPNINELKTNIMALRFWLMIVLFFISIKKNKQTIRRKAYLRDGLSQVSTKEWSIVLRRIKFSSPS